MEAWSTEFVEVIKTHLHNSGHSNIVINTEPGSSKGDNYMGVITKTTIDTINKEGAKTTFNWIIKSASSDEKYRDLMQVPAVFERETLMYEKVFPEFTKLQAKLDADKRFESWAKSYLSYNGIPESIAMENMKELGYVMKNRQEPLDLNHSMLVMKEYGKYHALSFALKLKNPDIYTNLENLISKHFWGDIQFDTTPDLNAKIRKGIQDKVGDDVLEKFDVYSGDTFKIIIDKFGKSQLEDYTVLCHGDSWVNNILFKYENENPTKLCFLDFQLSTLCSPAMDLSYFIFTCTSKELRDDHYDELLKTYHDSLKSFLQELSCDPEYFPFESLLEHMKKYAIYGLMMCTMVTHLMMSEVDEIPELNADSLENQELFLYDSVHEDAYNERMKNVIEEFVQREYL